MENKKQTAVDWLFMMLNNPNKDQEFAYKLFDKAKEIEEQQIEAAFMAGGRSAFNMAKGRDFQTLENYYNETYSRKSN
jgi:hypothetical protein